MKKFWLFLFLVISLFFYIKAINPHDLVGKPFLFDCFYETYYGGPGIVDTVYINLDCFYNYTSTKPINKLISKKNRYCSNGKYTCPDSIYRHRFVGLQFIDEPKKRSFFIFKDEKGDTVLMTFPKFKPSSQYWSNKIFYSHRSIKSIISGYDSYHTFIDLTASQIKDWEQIVDTILSSQSISFRHPAISVPAYKILRVNYVKDGWEGRRNNEHHNGFAPTVDLLKNDSIILCNSDVKKLSEEVVDVKRKIGVLQEYIKSFDYSLIDSASVFLNNDVWIDDNIVHNAICPSTSSYKNGWEMGFNLGKIKKTLSSAALGGPTYQFHLAHISGITLLPNLRTIVEQHDYETSRSYTKPKVFTPSDSLEFRYYIILKRSPDTLYPIPNSLGYDSDTQKLGCEFSDSCFIPLTKETLLSFISPSKMAEIHDGFYQREKEAWKDFNEEQRAYYEIATRAWGEAIAQIVCRGEVRLGFDEEMCHFAFMRTPYRTSSAHTPLGIAECQDFYMEGVKLYFQNKILIGIEWRGNSLFEPRHRY